MATSEQTRWQKPGKIYLSPPYPVTLDEEKTHFALWSLAKAPLIIGCDLSIVSAESLAILMNQDLIAVN